MQWVDLRSFHGDHKAAQTSLSYECTSTIWALNVKNILYFRVLPPEAIVWPLYISMVY